MKNKKGQFTKEVRATREAGEVHGVWIGFILGVVAALLLYLVV